jgi:hypothetical protein
MKLTDVVDGRAGIKDETDVWDGRAGILFGTAVVVCRA